MRPSLTDIQQGDRYLHGHMPQDEAAVYEARLLTNDTLKEHTHFLQKTFALLRIYHRRQLRAEAAAVQQRLFTDPKHTAFQQNIRRLFKQ